MVMALASKGAGGAKCKLTPLQLAELEAVLEGVIVRCTASRRRRSSYREHREVCGAGACEMRQG